MKSKDKMTRSELKIKFILLIKVTSGYLLILTPLVIFSLIIGKFLNVIEILIIYSLTRFILPKTFHAKTSTNCICISIFSFLTAIIISLPINLSIFYSICIGAIISVILFFVQDYLDVTRFGLKTCTEKTLRNHSF